MMDEHEYCRNCLKQSGCKDWRNVIHGCPDFQSKSSRCTRKHLYGAVHRIVLETVMKVKFHKEELSCVKSASQWR